MPDNRRQPKTPEERALNYIRAHNLIKAGELIMIGVSGGPDSICLLSILHLLKDELDVRLHIAHLNHELRGVESDADAAFVADFARKIEIPATIERRDVKSYQEEKHLSLEAAARDVRYAFFEELAAKLGAAKVAVGHTSSDQIETVLMHLIRGSGTRGLTGLQPETVLRPGGRPLKVIRPILMLSHDETEAYCRDHGFRWRTDSSNLLPNTQRNRIRLELIPLLRKYNPEIEQAVLRTAAITLDDTIFLDAATQTIWGDVVHESDSSIDIDKARFLTLHPSLQRSLLRKAIEALAGDPRNIELVHIEDIMSIIVGGAGKRINLPDDLVFTVGYEEFALRSGNELPAKYVRIDGRYEINIPGETFVPCWRIEAELANRECSGGLSTDAGKFTAFFDFDKTGGQLFARGRRPGDRFVPLGMVETKTIAEFLIDAKVPRAERPGIPIVESENQIVWLVGTRMDGRVRVTEVTKRVLRLKFERI
jgi:tRNA(Ile)-lysidine synthase